MFARFACCLHVIDMFSACPHHTLPVRQGDRVLISEFPQGGSNPRQYYAWVVLVLKTTSTPGVRRGRSKTNKVRYKLVNSYTDRTAYDFPPIGKRNVGKDPVFKIRKSDDPDKLSCFQNRCGDFKWAMKPTKVQDKQFRDWTNHSKGHSTDIACRGDQCYLQRKDLRRLAIPPTVSSRKDRYDPRPFWLNDNVINFYLKLLVRKTSRPGFRVHVLNSHFFTNLNSRKNFKAGYKRVRACFACYKRVSVHVDYIIHDTS